MFTDLIIIDTGEINEGGRIVCELAAPFSYQTPYIGPITVPSGTRVDFASVPKQFWGWPLYFSPFGPWNRAAVIHDYLYQQKVTTRWMADGIFRACLSECGVNWWRRWAMWAAVRVGGPRWKMKGT